LASEQLSEASEARLSNLGASAPSFRPHLVATDRSEEVDLGDGGYGITTRDGAQIMGIPSVCVSDPDFALVARSRDVISVHRSWSLRAGVKRAFDMVGAIVLGLVFLPLMLAIVWLLRNEGGPVIYRHRRMGRDGKSFECLKFRSMVPDADEKLRVLLERHPELKAEWLRDHKLRDDPRVTAIGRFLRRTSLDELPQIWNVLRGEMSLVGPRPIVREEMMRYGRWMRTYFSAKPGLTGLWQVMGRNDTNYRRRVAIDVYYVRKRSALLDLYILLKTTRVILGGGGAY